MSEARILLIGDLHIKISNLLETEKLSDILINIIIDNMPDMVIVMGDTLHNNDKYDGRPFAAAINLFKRIVQLTRLGVIIGNHDIPGPNSYMTDIHPFGALELWPNTILIDKAVIFTINNLTFGAVPYVPVGRLHEALQTNPNINPMTFNGVFSHQQIKGCKGIGYDGLDGDVWPSEYCPIFNGHIHEYGRYGNVLCVGTPRHVSFREIRSDSVFDDIKTVSLITFSDKVPWKEDRIVVPLPRKYTQKIHASLLAKYIPPEGVDVKLVITGDKAEISAICGSPVVIDLQNKGVIVDYDDISNNSNTNVTDTTLPIRAFRTSIENVIANDVELMNLFREIC